MSRKRCHLITLSTHATARARPQSADVYLMYHTKPIFSAPHTHPPLNERCASTVEQPCVRGKVPFGSYVLPYTIKAVKYRASCDPVVWTILIRQEVERFY